MEGAEDQASPRTSAPRRQVAHVCGKSRASEVLLNAPTGVVLDEALLLLLLLLLERA